MNNAHKLNDSLISDLGVLHFKDEADSDYFNRLIYTAASCWIRNMLLDNSLSNIFADEKDILRGVSRRHLSEKLTIILFGLISIIPCNYKCNQINDEKFLMYKSNELADQIIDRMKDNYEISESSGRIVTTPLQRLRFNRKSLVVGGNQSRKIDNIIITGIGKWDDAYESDTLYSEAWSIPINHSEYIKQLVDNVIWRSDTIPNDVVIYKYHNNGYGISESHWTNKKLNILNDGLYLGKNSKLGTVKYYLINIIDSHIQVALLNEWYYLTREYMRIIYASANKQGYCPEIKVHIGIDHVELTLNCVLPQAEYRIIQLSSWDKVDNTGKTLKVIPLDVWNEVSQIFTNLGISIKEI